MSKSLGNFYTLRDLLRAWAMRRRPIRYLLASVPYRKKLNFTFDGLKAAATAIDRLRNFKLRLETDKFAEGVNEQLAERTAGRADSASTRALDDDLNTAEALAAVFEYVRDTNTAMDAGEFLAGNVAGGARIPGPIRFASSTCCARPPARQASPTREVEALIAERAPPRRLATSRAPTRFAQQLLDGGIILEDTKEGVALETEVTA